jgi:GH24 family phage-related lysozyme (muramidase)
MRITQAQAEEFLKKDLEGFERSVSSAVKVPLTEDQFSALVSFVYNVGSGAFSNSTLLRLLNQGKYKESADQLLRWDGDGKGGHLPGLTRRRKCERVLFLGGDWRSLL